MSPQGIFLGCRHVIWTDLESGYLTLTADSKPVQKAHMQQNEHVAMIL